MADLAVQLRELRSAPESLLDRRRPEQHDDLQRDKIDLAIESSLASPWPESNRWQRIVRSATSAARLSRVDGSTSPAFPTATARSRRTAPRGGGRDGNPSLSSSNTPHTLWIMTFVQPRGGAHATSPTSVPGAHAGTVGCDR
jgi:hypothetical protein